MLLSTLSEIVGRAFQSCGVDSTFGRVQRADRPDLADVQCNGALQAAKLLGQKPRDIAEKIVSTLQSNTTTNALFDKIEIAGPGFINFTLSVGYLTQHAQAQHRHDHLGFDLPPRQKILLEYCSPNLAKDMHVGHLRNTVIGDAVKRLLQFAGHEVITDNHLGDWGLQLGQVFSEMARLYPDLPYFQQGFTGPFPTEAPITFEELCKIFSISDET